MSANLIKTIVVIGGIGLMTATVLVMNKFSKKEKERG